RGVQTRRVLAADDAIGVLDRLRPVVLEQTHQVVVLNHRRRGIGHAQKTPMAPVVAFQAPADSIVGQGLADTLEDLLVREVAKDVAREPETHVQAIPEAITRLHLLAVERYIVVTLLARGRGVAR